MKLNIAPENSAADAKLPSAEPDASGIGVHYTDAYIKALNVELEDGRKITCKRKGLKLLLAVGDDKGEAIVRRIDHGPDVKNMLRKALEGAATDAGYAFAVEDGMMTLTKNSEAANDA